MLYKANWDTETVINDLITRKNLTYNFIRRWHGHLGETVNDPDYLWFNAPEELTDELISRNLILYFLPRRMEPLWIDEPPPERDLELGIGRYVAWQTPLHREAVRRALEAFRP